MAAAAQTTPSAGAHKSRVRNVMMVIVGAALVHLATTFLAMNDIRPSAYTRLVPQLEINKMTILEPVKPGQQPLPFLGADARYAMCRFDSRQGPVAVTAYLADAGWTLGVYHADGTSAYFATTPPGKPAAVNLTILSSPDRFLGVTEQALGKAVTGDPPESVSVKDGLIVVRAPQKGSAYIGTAEQGLAKAKCVQHPY